MKENYYDFERKPKRNNCLEKKIDHSIDKCFKVTKQHSKTKYTSKDIVYFNNKVLKMENSVLFYLNHYYKKIQYYKFDIRIPKALHSVSLS